MGLWAHLGVLALAYLVVKMILVHDLSTVMDDSAAKRVETGTSRQLRGGYWDWLEALRHSRGLWVSVDNRWRVGCDGF